MNVGGPELVIILVLLLGAVIPIVTVIDVATKPDAAFRAAGSSKVLWIILPVVGMLSFGIISLVAAIIWFAAIRPKVVAAA